MTFLTQVPVFHIPTATTRPSKSRPHHSTLDTSPTVQAPPPTFKQFTTDMLPLPSNQSMHSFFLNLATDKLSASLLFFYLSFSYIVNTCIYFTLCHIYYCRRTYIFGYPHSPHVHYYSSRCEPHAFANDRCHARETPQCSLETRPSPSVQFRTQLGTPTIKCVGGKTEHDNMRERFSHVMRALTYVF